MSQKHTDIVPITFIHGTGGNFLCSFIIAAKNNNQTPFVLSYHGNMHENSLKDIPTEPTSIENLDQLKIDSIINGKIMVDISPYYTSSHISDLELLQNYFERSIRITYDNNDILEISNAYIGKFWLDQKSYKKDINVLHKISINTLTKYQSKFYEQLIDNVLFISWDTLLHGDSLVLIEKLSNFTQIPMENFNIDNLNHWRERTRLCIKKIHKLLT
jgi:hypothetical protein